MNDAKAKLEAMKTQIDNEIKIVDKKTELKELQSKIGNNLLRRDPTNNINVKKPLSDKQKELYFMLGFVLLFGISVLVFYFVVMR